MNRVALDFRRVADPLPWGGWLLLALSLAFAADLATTYRTQRSQLARSEAQLARASSAGDAAKRVPALARPISTEEMALARQAARRLALPWETLFHALEQATDRSVALLAIEPDAATRTVRITGECRDYAAVLAYVAALGRDRDLSGVHLLKHETRQEDPQHPLVFTLSASWGPTP
jgi:Tfp pilus assembly protein PilN